MIRLFCLFPVTSPLPLSSRRGVRIIEKGLRPILNIFYGIWLIHLFGLSLLDTDSQCHCEHSEAILCLKLRYQQIAASPSAPRNDIAVIYVYSEERMMSLFPVQALFDFLPGREAGGFGGGPFGRAGRYSQFLEFGLEGRPHLFHEAVDLFY